MYLTKRIWGCLVAMNKLIGVITANIDLPYVPAVWMRFQEVEKGSAEPSTDNADSSSITLHFISPLI